MICTSDVCPTSLTKELLGACANERNRFVRAGYEIMDCACERELCFERSS